MSRPRIPQPPLHDLMRLRRDGIAYEQIAEQYGASTNTVFNWLKFASPDEKREAAARLDREDMAPHFALVLMSLINASLRQQLRQCSEAYVQLYARRAE